MSKSELLWKGNNFVVVVEVTLIDNSRQEAAEGETVRRHVADLARLYFERSRKPVCSQCRQTMEAPAWKSAIDEAIKNKFIVKPVFFAYCPETAMRRPSAKPH